jgi:GNAT superfamily N-acetyltransferase
MRELPDDVSVRRVRADEWRRARALRLEALRDPMAAVAFLDTVEAASARPDDEWREATASRAHGDGSAQFVAERGGELIGTLGVFVREAGTPDYFGRVHETDLTSVVGVYVSPAARGLGVIDALLAAAAGWARSRGDLVLTLDVHETNLPAIRAYERAGFDVRSDFVGEAGRELGMVQDLA